MPAGQGGVGFSLEGGQESKVKARSYGENEATAGGGDRKDRRHNGGEGCLQ